jgi:hypothetical protein
MTPLPRSLPEALGWLTALPAADWANARLGAETLLAVLALVGLAVWATRGRGRG